MTKEQFIRSLAKKHRRPQSHYRSAITEIFDGLKEQLASGKSVGFLGFGTFLTRVHKGGKGINFKTKKQVLYKEYRRAAFTPGSLLKRAVRRKRGLFGR
jgi:nucleoid DNA-binding protein